MSDDGWSDLTFFCLFWLKMTPDQVASMIAPNDPVERALAALYIRGRWEYARRHVVIERCLRAQSLRKGKMP